MNNDWTPKTIAHLTHIVRMIPVCARLVDLSPVRTWEWKQKGSFAYLEIILESATWRNGALTGTGGAIHCGSACLENTMPMESSGLVTESIVYIHHYPVSHVHVYLGAWPLSVDTYNRPSIPIRTRSHPCDVPVISNCLGKRQAGEAKQEEGECEHAEQGRL